MMKYEGSGTMISTKWLQGMSNINEVIKIREKVFVEELKNEQGTSDIYDEFAFNVVAYVDDAPAGTGRLLFKDGMYCIDNLCVLKEYRGNSLGSLIIRMLVRRAVNMGAENTFASINKECRIIFEKVGFEKVEEDEHGKLLMKKVGDVGGHCSNH
jgi:N-acetylglutamate synthase-like GNAT family acetyltransferase